MKRFSLILLLLKRMTLRHWLKTPRQTFLQIFILSLGIAVFFSIRLANKAALSSFEHFTTLLHQESDYQLKATTGELSTSILKELRESLGAMPVELIPILDLTATEPFVPNEHAVSRPLFQLVGLDLVALQNLRSPEELENSSSAPNQKIAGLFISHELGLKKHLKIGDLFPLVVQDEMIDFHIAGWIPETPSHPKVSSRLIMVDLPFLQSLTHHEGKISQIGCLLPEGPLREEKKKELLEILKKNSRGHFEITTSQDERKKTALMTKAFRTNLTILSFIALLAGLYLIFQALDGAVVRRRREIAILRSLGITEQMIHHHWLIEALLLGLCGGIVGSLLGWGAAQLAVRSVAAVVSALYYTTTVEAAHLDGGEFLLAMILAIGSALLTGWWPARQAARTPPAQILSQEYDRERPNGLLQSMKLGFLFLLLSGCLSLAPVVTLFKTTRLPLGGYVATFFLILGGGIFCGAFIEKLGALFSFFGKFSPMLRLAMSHLHPLSKRHYFAASGILCGVTMAAGMLILIESFETTLHRWIDVTFQADLYISSADYQGNSLEHQIAPPIWQEIAHDPAVVDVQVIASHTIILNKLPTMMSGIDIDFLKRHHNILWKQHPINDNFFHEEKNAHLLLANESFLERFHVKLGDHLMIPTPSGTQEMTIAGVFSDYGNEQGSLFLDRRHFITYFDDNLATILIVMLRSGVDAEELRLQLASRFPGLTILTNKNLREEILRVFHQTFSITYALELIGIIVAIIGLGMTLSNILMDRTKEITTLRALGCSYHTIALATALEGGILAMSGAVVGIMSSLGIGSILIYVINKQSFGWTLQFTLPYFSLALLGIAVVISGVSVAYGVAFKCSQLNVDHHE
ncbi:MAG: FtsX-like permease family protein [Chthoniobacterales bacterium]